MAMDVMNGEITYSGLMGMNAYKKPQRLSFDDVVRSTFRILVHDEHSGTCLACRLDAQHVAFITCKHLFPDEENGDMAGFGIECRDSYCSDADACSFSGVLLHDGNPESDICAIIADDSALPCAIRFQDIAGGCFSEYCGRDARGSAELGDEVFVLGFPFIFDYQVDFETMVVGGVLYPKAVLRHGYVSAAHMIVNGTDAMLLDVASNHGFSGGPVVKKIISVEGCASYLPVGVLCGVYQEDVRSKETITRGCPLDGILGLVSRYMWRHTAVFRIEKRGAKAYALRTDDGVTVLSGSTISKDMVPSCPSRVLAMREKFGDDIFGSMRMLLKDVTFKTPSGAASFVMGRAANGNTEWKTSHGLAFGELERDESCCVASVAT